VFAACRLGHLQQKAYPCSRVFTLWLGLGLVFDYPLPHLSDLKRFESIRLTFAHIMTSIFDLIFEGLAQRGFWVPAKVPANP
jgi:hypothetical protein